MTGRSGCVLCFLASGFSWACDLPTDEKQVVVDTDEVEYRFHPPAPVDDKNDLLSYVAQCEAVLGEIPEIHCDPDDPAPGTNVTRIPVFENGRLLGFGSGEDEEALNRRSEEDDYSCDFPSIGGDFPCAVGSTLVQYRSEDNPNVQWVGLCRGVPTDTPGYNRFIGNGLIGANELTGEMCFFFGSNPQPDEPYELPKLTSEAESAQDLSPWLPPKQMPGSCISCHPNNDPWILTPWLQPSYMTGLLQSEEYPLELPPGVELEDVLAARYVRQTPIQYKSRLPDPLPEGRTAWTEEEIVDPDGTLVHRQYRVVGSSYVDNEAQGEVQPRTGVRPQSWSLNFRERLRLQPLEGSCAGGCHALGSANFEGFALDSLGDKYATSYLSELMEAQEMRGFSWMPLGGDPQPARASYDAGDASIPAITECPVPKRLDDVPDIHVDCQAHDDGWVEILWIYDNDYGAVPGRDDVRFDVAIDSVHHETPTRGHAAGGSPEGIRMVDDAAATVVRDVAPAEDGGELYSLRIPIGEGDRFIGLDLQPKRYCFEEPDRRPFTYAQPYRFEFEASCG